MAFLVLIDYAGLDMVGRAEIELLWWNAAWRSNDNDAPYADTTSNKQNGRWLDETRCYSKTTTSMTDKKLVSSDSGLYCS